MSRNEIFLWKEEYYSFMKNFVYQTLQTVSLQVFRSLSIFYVYFNKIHDVGKKLLNNEKILEDGLINLGEFSMDSNFPAKILINTILNTLPRIWRHKSGFRMVFRIQL